MLAIKPTAFTFNRCRLSARTVHRSKQCGRISKIIRNIWLWQRQKKICPNRNQQKCGCSSVVIKQLSDEGAALIEIRYKGLKFYGASLYFAILRDIRRGIEKVEQN
jgi:hypothetical protein